MLYLVKLFFFGLALGLFLNQSSIQNARAEILSTSPTHTCVIRNGGLWCWGTNEFGQLGTGQFSTGIGYPPATDRFTNPKKYGSLAPQLVKGLESGVTSVSVAAGTTCAVKDSAAYCFGRNNHGSLGNGTTIDSATATLVPDFDTGVTDIKVKAGHTCLIKDEALWCMGAYWDEKTRKGGNALTPMPMDDLQDKVESFTKSQDGMCVVRNKALWCTNGTLQAKHVSEFSWNVSLAFTEPHTLNCANKSDDIWCFGLNGVDDRFGDHSKIGTQVPSPVQVLGLPTSSKLLDLDSYSGGMYALYENGEIWTWGTKWDRPDDTGGIWKAREGIDLNRKPVLFQGIPANVKAMTAFGGRMCLLAENDDVYCSGQNHIPADVFQLEPFTRITGLPQEASIPSANSNAAPSNSGMNHGLEVTIPFCSSPLPQPLSLVPSMSSKISDIYTDPNLGHTHVLFPNVSRLYGLPILTNTGTSPTVKVGQCDTSATLPNLKSYIDLSLQSDSRVLEMNGRFTKHPTQSGDVRGTVVFNLYPDPNISNSAVDCTSIPKGRAHMTLSVQTSTGSWKVVQYFGRKIEASPDATALKKSDITWEVSTDKVPSGSRVKFEFFVPDDTGCKARIYQARLFGVQCYPDPLDPESCL